MILIKEIAPKSTIIWVAYGFSESCSLITQKIKEFVKTNRLTQPANVPKNGGILRIL